ncbi:hypothetical protein VV869_14995 [Photobacterium sp. MCCC 1A19761]|uniref:hypothetical protein n=1 Tax=Photobacterium sp. MCCC 1A19761 TaxID=3115000 RepID=UPI00307D0C57
MIEIEVFMFDFFTQLPIWFYVIAIVTNLPLILSDSPKKKNKLWPIITVINAINFTVMIRLFQGDIPPSFYVMIGIATLASALKLSHSHHDDHSVFSAKTPGIEYSQYSP